MNKVDAHMRLDMRTTLLSGVLMLALAPGLGAEEPFRTSLDASVARDFVGEWAITIDMQGREMHIDLAVVDLEGKIGATVDSARQAEPLAIDEIDVDERGHLVLTYEMPFGQQSFDLTIVAELAPEGLEGTIEEASGLFSAKFTGKEAINDPERTQQRRRNRHMAANMARLRLGEDRLRVNFNPLKIDSDDYQRLDALKEGEVFEYVGGRATKLFTDVDMDFGGTIVKTENAAPDYPGVYSLWLKKTADGWDLLFNEEADIWGTMYNPEATVAEAPLQSSRTSTSTSDTFKANLEETATGGLLSFVWGDRMWSAAFNVEGYVGEAKTAAALPAALVGTWSLDADSALGPLAQALVVTQSGVPTFTSDGVASDITSFNLDGDRVTFNVTIQGYDVHFDGVVDGDSLEGNYLMDGDSVATVVGRKNADTTQS